jgi:hypothetical protein
MTVSSTSRVSLTRHFACIPLSPSSRSPCRPATFSCRTPRRDCSWNHIWARSRYTRRRMGGHNTSPRVPWIGADCFRGYSNPSASLARVFQLTSTSSLSAHFVQAASTLTRISSFPVSPCYDFRDSRRAPAYRIDFRPLLLCLGYPALHAFSAGSGLASTSLGTTFVVLRAQISV